MTAARWPVRLSKRDVERLWSDYDNDAAGALEVALRQLTNRPIGRFDELVRALAEQGRIGATRRDDLLRRDDDALDALAAELSETRTLPS